jgi:hypothetical protein
VAAFPWKIRASVAGAVDSAGLGEHAPGIYRGPCIAHWVRCHGTLRIPVCRAPRRRTRSARSRRPLASGRTPRDTVESMGMGDLWSYLPPGTPNGNSSKPDC